MVKKRYKPLIILYFIALIATCFSRIVNIFSIELIAKPVLMLILAFYFYLAVKKPLLKISKILLASLFFSWLGDIFLMWAADLNFMLGLGSFLLAHLCYIFCFKPANLVNKLSLINKKPFLLFIFIAFEGFMLYNLYPNVGTIFLPIALYTTIINVMAVTALNRYGFVNNLSFKLVFIGAVMFVFSDTLIAINRFLSPVPLANIWIMLLYAVGQLFIVQGMIEEVNS